MKAILEFDLNDVENDERSQFEDAVNGHKWKYAMWQLNQWLRSQTKYAPDDTPEEAYKAFEQCRDQLFEILNNQSLNLD